MDIDKELRHITDWLSFSVEFKIDEVSEDLDRKIYHKEGFFASFFGLYNEKGRDRFYKRDTIKSESFRVYRKEIEINEETDALLMRDKDYVTDKIRKIISVALPNQGEEIIKPYVDFLSETVEAYERNRDERLQWLFGDDMPLKLNGLLDEAIYGGTTYIYRGY